jgi:hypothetical protein
MISEWWIGKHVEESGRGLIYGTIPALAWNDWGKRRKSSVMIASVRPSLNPGPLKYQSRVLTTWPWLSVSSCIIIIIIIIAIVVKLSLHTIQGPRRREDIASTHWPWQYIRASGQRHAPAALYPLGKDPWYPLDWRLGRPQSWSGHRG